MTTLAKTTVKFRLFSPDGLAAIGLCVSARLTCPDTDTGSGAVVPSANVMGTTDESGECALLLWPNSRGSAGSQYQVTVSRSVKKIDEYTITVPESDIDVIAEDIRSTPPYPPVSAAQQALEAAQQALIAAQQAVFDAGSASRLTIGEITTLDAGEEATATITGEPGSQVLNLGIPRGAEGGGGGAGGTDVPYYITLPFVDGGSDYRDYPPDPQPGFVHVVATPTGLRMLNSDGDWVGGGGGGLSEPIPSLRFVELGTYENMPRHGINGEVTFGYVFGELVKQLPSGAVVGLDNTVRWSPAGGGGGGAPE